MYNRLSIKKHYHFSMRGFIYYCFLVFVFFPYLQLFPTGTDMQPFALFSAVLLFFVFEIKIKKVEIPLLWMLLAAFLLLMLGDFSFLTLRSFANYASVFFISYVSFRVLNSGRVNFERFFFTSFFVWFLVSLIQTYIKSDFLTFLVSASRTTEDRGVTGLAPEPTFLGIVYLFYLILALHIPTLMFRKRLIFLTVFGILFMAKSSMVMLFLILMLCVFFITHVSLKSLFSFAISLASFLYLISFLEGSRLHRLLEMFISDPYSLVLIDASINDRFFHVFFSLKGFLDNFLLPHGYFAWLPYVKEQLIIYQDFVLIDWFSLGGRIMSGYGGALFELGFFFLTVPLVVVVLLFRLYRDNLRLFFFFSIYVNMIMFSAIPIGFPLFAFYLGFLVFLAEKKAGELH